MMQRSSQVGEFYRMAPPAVFNERVALPSTFMDILIYDEEADKLQHMTFEEALYATCVGNGGLSPCLLFGFGIINNAGVLIPNPRFDRNAAAKWDTHYDQVNRIGAVPDSVRNPAEMVALEYNAGAGNPATPTLVIRAILANVKGGIWTPLCITIARPFIEHLMMSAIMTVSGRDTGATLFGPADMQISANTSVKTIEGMHLLVQNPQSHPNESNVPPN